MFARDFFTRGIECRTNVPARKSSPHFSHSMWPAPVQEADRAGAARSAMWDIGQARRRPLSASSTGPSGCLSAGISSVGRLNRMPRYGFRRPTLCLPRRKSNAGHMECEKGGLKLLPLLDAVGALGVGDGDEADDAAVAAVPVPREEREGAAPPGHLVEVAAHVLDPQDAVLEQDAVDRLPFREVLLPVAAARPFLVFLGEMRMQRPVALRADRCRQRMVV